MERKRKRGRSMDFTSITLKAQSRNAPTQSSCTICKGQFLCLRHANSPGLSLTIFGFSFWYLRFSSRFRFWLLLFLPCFVSSFLPQRPLFLRVSKVLVCFGLGFWLSLSMVSPAFPQGFRVWVLILCICCPSCFPHSSLSV